MKHRRIASLAAMTVIALLVAGSAGAGLSKVDGGIEFTFDDTSAGSVSLAGDFNNWNMNADPLSQDADGIWSVVVDLAPGEYEYKFVVNGSEWVADPENPRVVGDYGNSGLTVDDAGELASIGAADAISNTSANSRVQLNGWYRATYDTQNDVPSDPRWRLNRPAHEFYIGVNPTVTSVASGSAVVRLSTGVGDYKEMSADIYSGHVTLEGGPFTVTGFYNEEVLQFDDPLETVGHIDLDYTISEEHIPFGRGAQGIIVGTEFWDLDLNAAYTNIYDHNTMNDPGLYDNTETDLLAARLKRSLGPVTLGTTFTSRRDGWWIGFDSEANSSQAIDDYLADNPESQSNWFELSNTETWIGIDADVPVVSGLLYAQAEVARYRFKSLWDVGNLEKVEGESYANGAIDIPVGETDGWIVRGVLNGSPLPVLDLRLELTKTAIDSMSSDGQYVAYSNPSWRAESQGTFSEISSHPLTVNIYGPAPERDEFGMEFDAVFGFGIFDARLEYDMDNAEWTYPEEVESTFGSFDTWSQSTSRFALSGTAALTERISAGFAIERVLEDYDVSYLEDPSRVEAIATANVGLWSDWSLIMDLRSVSYSNTVRPAESAPDSIHYSDEAYVAPYVALVYSPRENVEIRVGYGVNPTNYTDTPVEGRGNGRERWLSGYLWEHSAYDILDAEAALADARVIGVMAVITF